MSDTHHRPLADEYLPEAISRINEMNVWVLDKWPLLLDIKADAKTNTGGEYHKTTADRFRKVLAHHPEWLRGGVYPPGYLKIDVVIVNGKSTCQYYNTSRYLGKDNPQEVKTFTLADVQSAFCNYEKQHLDRIQAEAQERAAYWPVHHFFKD